MKQYVAVGLTVLAGAALIEVALIPGVLIGGVAVLAPKYLPGLLRRKPATRRAPRSGPRSAQLPIVRPRFALGQAVAKTITFRIIVTSLDFTTNYIVIGELATAAGLSSFNLVAGPLFYLAHEAAWNYLDSSEAADEVPLLESSDAEPRTTLAGFTLSRALAKTITFRTIATAVDFTANYVVVGELATAVLLSASGFVLGPFVYFGHEKAWEYFTRDAPPRDAAEEMKLLPAPLEEMTGVPPTLSSPGLSR